MFSFFSRNKTKRDESSSPPASSSLLPPKNSSVLIDFFSAVEGPKGWPADVNTVLYHVEKGVICVGTSSGSLYSFGKGFQFLHPSINEEYNEITYMVALPNGLLFAVYGDNSLAVFTVPHLTLVARESNWLSRKMGDISCVYCDDIGGKSFVYIGTSNGFVVVVEANSNAIRVCDYSISLSDCNISEMYAVSDISICPKDERYLAIAYDGMDESSGSCVIFDMVKRKPYRSYSTGALTTLAWTHTGETLYAGCREGEIISLGLDKHSLSSAYCSSKERSSLDESDDPPPINIRKISWVSPQPSTGQGCLFVLLGQYGEDTEYLKSVIVCLSPIGSSGEMITVLNIPPLHSEDIVGFRVVPTGMVLSENPNSSPGNQGSGKYSPIPALLLLTQRPVESVRNDDIADNSSDDGTESKFCRRLKILRCPTSFVNDWPLEHGLIPEPKCVVEVLPGSDDITCVKASSPSTALFAFLRIMYMQSCGQTTQKTGPRSSGSNISSPCASPHSQQSQPQGPKANRLVSRRLSTSEFFFANGLTSFDDGTVHDDWKIILSGNNPQYMQKISNKTHSTIFLGQADGNVIAWAVCRLESKSGAGGHGSSWVPLAGFNCGTSAISALFIDEQSPFFACGDISGNFVIWEIFDSHQNMGYSSYQFALKKRHEKEKELALSRKAREQQRDINPKELLDKDEADDMDGSVEDDEEEEEVLEPLYFSPDSYRILYKGTVDEEISTITACTDICHFVLGTKPGNVYIWAPSFNEEDNSTSSPIRVMSNRSGLRGPVSHITPSLVAPSTLGLSFPGANCPHFVVLVFYASGWIDAINVLEYEMISSCTSLLPEESQNDRRKSSSRANNKRNDSDSEDECIEYGNVVDETYCCAVDQNRKLCTKPETSDCIALWSYLSSLKKSSSTSQSKVSTNTSSNSASSSGAPVSRRGFWFSNSKNSAGRPTSPSTTSSSSSSNTIESSSSTSALPIQFNTILANGPRLLLICKGRELIELDISRFASSTKATAAVSSRRIVARNPVISVTIMAFVEEAARAYSDPIQCLSLVSTDGSIVVVSVGSGSNVGSTSLLESIIAPPAKVSKASLLPSGDCFMVNDNGIIFCCRIESSTHIVTVPVPMNIALDIVPPAFELQLSHGRDKQLAASAAAIKKRRQSMISITSGPADLDKIFFRTRDQRMKDELLEEEDDDNEYDSDGGHRRKASSSSFSSMSSNTASIASVGQEIREGFAQRGEKLSRLTRDLDQVQANAKEYREAVKSYKEKLRQKNARWGLF